MQSQVMSGPTREQVEDILRSGSINSKHASSNGMADAILALYAPLVADRDVALAALERAGYRRCDIPACNCGRWHAGPDSFKGKFDYALEQSAMYQDECERLRADLALAWPIARDALRWRRTHGPDPENIWDPDSNLPPPPAICLQGRCGVTHTVYMGGTIAANEYDASEEHLSASVDALTPDQRARLLEERP